jgi:hypothetical protein
VRVPLTLGKFALIDDADAPLLAGHRWTAHINRGVWYARSRLGGPTVLLHRLVLNAPSGVIVDHRNGDGLDNRRSNLRLATNAQNCRNLARRSNNTSGVPGVARNANGRWQAYLTINRRRVYLGAFVNIEDAKLARQAGERLYYGEFAPHLCRGVA